MKNKYRFNFKKIIYVFLCLFFGCKTTYANEIFQLDDFVYFDPITDKECNVDNYWTIYNQDTTCYRFVVLDSDDTSEKDKLKIMLDHNVAYTTYDDYQNVLDDISLQWKRYTGVVDIIDEDTIYDILKLTTKPKVDGSYVHGGTYYDFFATNSLYVLNQEKHQYYGFWSKTLYEENEDYVYTITYFGANSLVLRTHSRGIRPVIIVDKSQLQKMKDIVDISDVVKNSKLYEYQPTNKQYKFLQGFTFANNKLIFNSISGSDSEYGLISVYGDNQFKTLYSAELYKVGHGNDMTYNKKNNKILVPGASENSEIYQFDGETLKQDKIYGASDLDNMYYFNLAYDEINNLYLAMQSTIVYILDENFKKLYSFDLTLITSAVQGMEYHNGYLYVTTSVAPDACPNKYHLYCFYKSWSGMIYVYNAKFNNDGTPHKDFGKIVDRFYINDGIGELEGISFLNNNVYLGYAAYMYNSDYIYKFYNFSYDELERGIDYNVSYDFQGYGTIKKIVITSKEELKKISGWTLSEDLHTLSKYFVSAPLTRSVTICDLYDNCSIVKLNSIGSIGDFGKVDTYTTVIQFFETVKKEDNLTFEIVNKENQSKNDNDNIATGDVLKMIDDYGNVTSLKLSVKGDVLGTGIPSKEDVKTIASHIIDGNVILGNEYLMAGDIDQDGKIKMNDAMRILKSITNNS